VALVLPELGARRKRRHTPVFPESMDVFDTFKLLLEFERKLNYYHHCKYMHAFIYGKEGRESKREPKESTT
jgi:hypothetical protein